MGTNVPSGIAIAERKNIPAFLAKLRHFLCKWELESRLHAEHTKTPAGSLSLKQLLLMGRGSLQKALYSQKKNRHDGLTGPLCVWPLLHVWRITSSLLLFMGNTWLVQFYPLDLICCLNEPFQAALKKMRHKHEGIIKEVKLCNEVEERQTCASIKDRIKCTEVTVVSIFKAWTQL